VAIVPGVFRQVGAAQRAIRKCGGAHNTSRPNGEFDFFAQICESAACGASRGCATQRKLYVDGGWRDPPKRSKNGAKTDENR
jgi:hypothetical protein